MFTRRMTVRTLLVVCLCCCLSATAVAQIPSVTPDDFRQPLEHWVGELKSSDAMQRKKAAILIQQKRSSAQTAVPALAEALKDKDAEVRHFVAYALASLGPVAAKAAPALAAALNDEDSFVRARSAQALGAIGPKAKDHAGALAERLQDDDAFVRVSAAGSLWRLDAARSEECVKVLTASLSHDNSRSEAIWALGDLGPAAASAADDLVELLDEASELEQEWIARSLGQIGPTAKAALPRLMKLRETLPENKRGVVVAALAAVGPDDPQVIELLSAALRTEGDEGWYAAEALAKAGEKAVPILIAALETDDHKAEQSVAQALKEIGPAGAAAAHAIVAALRSAEGETVGELLEALGCIAANDPKIAASALELLDLPQFDSDTAAMAVGRALGAGGPRVAPVLVKALSSPHLRTRLCAAAALEGQQHHAAAAVEQLAELVNNEREDSRIRRQAALALAAIGPEVDGVMEAIVAHIAAAAKLPRLERDAVGVEELCEALCRFGPRGAAAAPALTSLLEVDPFDHAQQVLPALACLGPAAKAAAVPALRKLMEDESRFDYEAALAWSRIDPAAAEELLPVLTSRPPLRSDALEVLAELGPRAQPALEAIVQTLAESSEDWARYDALYALWRIDARGQGAQSVARLVDYLERTPDDRSRLLRLLAKFGPAAAEAAPQVREYLGDSDDYVRREAALTLWRLAPESAAESIAVFENELNGTDESASLQRFHRLPALAMLAELGAAAAPALPAIETRTRDPLPEVRRAAEDAQTKVRAAMDKVQSGVPRKEGRE